VHGVQKVQPFNPLKAFREFSPFNLLIAFGFALQTPFGSKKLLSLPKN
jgi:hypothetical protein